MINVIGLGYIGLPTALMMAAHGVEIVGTDCNKTLINTLNKGKTTFKEEGLDDLFEEALKSGIEFTTEYKSTNVYIISVPTPYDKTIKKINTIYLQTAFKNVMQVCKKGSIVVIESTISPGTIDKYIRPIAKENGYDVGEDIHLVHAPERIIPGNMIYELINNNRTIGADNFKIGERVKNIYSSFCKGNIEITDIRTAEMTKVVENTFRDINIAYANELAKICRHDNMDVYEIIRIANKHPRVNILSPGPGVGGHCIPVDPWFLVGDYPHLTNIILKAREINDSMPEYVLKRIYEIIKDECISDYSRIGLYGITYKENVDDIRDSPTLKILENIKNESCLHHIKVYDPYIQEDIVKNQFHNLDEFLKSIDLIVLLVAHDEIKLNINKLENKIIFDTKNILKGKHVYKL